MTQSSGMRRWCLWLSLWPAERLLGLLWHDRLYRGPYWRRSLAAWALGWWGYVAGSREEWRHPWL